MLWGYVQVIISRACISTSCYCPRAGWQALSRPGVYPIEKVMQNHCYNNRLNVTSGNLNYPNFLTCKGWILVPSKRRHLLQHQ